MDNPTPPPPLLLYEVLKYPPITQISVDVGGIDPIVLFAGGVALLSIIFLGLALLIALEKL